MLFGKSVIIAISMLLVINVAQASDTDTGAIKRIIADVKYGWENGDGTPFKQHFLNFDGGGISNQAGRILA